jgi:hypothetical protein
VAGLQAIFAAYSSGAPDKPLVIGSLPTYDEINTSGLEKYF